MNSTRNKLLAKIDDSAAMSRHRDKHVILKKKGPHIGLYVKTNNNHKWVCWVNKSEQHLLNEIGITTLKKYLQKKLDKTNSYDQASALHQKTQVLQTF